MHAYSILVPLCSIPRLSGRVQLEAGTRKCRELAEHPELVVARRVLELGSGTGLCGILASKLGAAQARSPSSSACSRAFFFARHRGMNP